MAPLAFKPALSKNAIDKNDYDKISRTHFERSYFPPPDMTFAKSDALYPPAELAKVIGIEYEGQCKLLCYGPYPSWEVVQTKLTEIRELL